MPRPLSRRLRRAAPRTRRSKSWRRSRAKCSSAFLGSRLCCLGFCECRRQGQDRRPHVFWTCVAGGLEFAARTGCAREIRSAARHRACRTEAIRTVARHVAGRGNHGQPLTDELKAKIQQQLRGMFGGEPVLVPKIKPELIGGVVLRVGDSVYDGSVAARLADMRGRIINRSVHEIQSRRDSFSNPAGN